MSQYNLDNITKSDLVTNIFNTLEQNKKYDYDSVDKEISYNSIQIETNNLLNREKTLFTINTIIIIGLVIIIFRIG